MGRSIDVAFNRTGYCGARAACAAILSAAAAAIGGCAAHPGPVSGPADGPGIYLSHAQSEDGASPGAFQTHALGAGDALGQAMYVNYIEYVRANGPYQQSGAAIVNVNDGSRAQPPER